MVQYNNVAGSTCLSLRAGNVSPFCVLTLAPIYVFGVNLYPLFMFVDLGTGRKAT
jgi:hypothetical protein